MPKKPNTNDPSPEEIAAIVRRKAEVDAERSKRIEAMQEETAAKYYYGSFRINRPIHKLSLPPDNGE